MKQYKIGRYVLLAAIGFIIFAFGLIMIKSFPESEGIFKTLPYICIGVGVGIFGSNLGTALKNKTVINNPAAARQIEIELNDERNQIISNKAKARAYDLMLYAYAAILLAFALMQVDIYVILTLTAAYLLYIFVNVYFLAKYHKEM